MVERDDGGEVDEKGQDPLQQCSRLLGRAAPGVVYAGLPWRLPSFSLQLIDEVVDNQVESAELKEDLGIMKQRKALISLTSSLAVTSPPYVDRIRVADLPVFL